MLTIPIIPINWKFECRGKGSTLLKHFIKEFVKITLYHEKIKNDEIEVEIILKNKEAIKFYNKQFFDKDEPTDIISIPVAEEIAKEGPSLLGTILLCLPLIKEDAEYLKTEYIHHIAHLTIHSTLHLLGYTHDDAINQQSMEAKEVQILTKLRIKNPYAKQTSSQTSNAIQ